MLFFLKSIKCICGFILLTLSPILSFAQSPVKEVNEQSQSWISINSSMHLHKKLGLIADLHARRNHFMADPGFYFARIGINYWIRQNMTAAVGYGHLWAAASRPGWHHFANENRVYQQIQLSTKLGKTTLLNRIRNEQRWQEKIVNDKFIHQYKFTNRIRYLSSVTMPVFKQPKYPALVISDELAIQFGKEVVYNTFDQNRFFIGIKQPVSKTLSFDFGYMLVTQQKASGYQYDKNNTLRLFFYYNADWRKKGS